MALEPLASIDDVELRLPGALGPNDGTRTQVLLSDASAVVRNYCRRTFTLTEDVARVRPIGSRLRLPDGPVHAINSVGVVFNDGVLAMPAYQWDGGDEIWLDVAGQTVINLSAAAVELLSENRTPLVEVDYVHGYDPVPPEIVSVVANMVARALQVPSQIVDSQTVGPFSYQLGASASQGAMGLDIPARQILNAFRRAGSTVELR